MCMYTRMDMLSYVLYVSSRSKVRYGYCQHIFTAHVHGHVLCRVMSLMLDISTFKIGNINILRKLETNLFEHYLSILFA